MLEMDATTQQPRRVPAISVSGISKRFGGTHALNDVTFDVPQGTVHALLGGNGSGKSTLIKILAGVYQADSGRIEVDGQRHSAERTTPDWARAHGIHVVHQNLGVFPDLTVADNVALSAGYQARALAPISDRRLRREVQATLSRFDIKVSPAALMGDIPPVLHTMVAVARALASSEEEAGHGILILDEPTAVMPQKERALLLDTVRGYNRHGHTVIIVTHRLDEVLAVADQATFLRDGRYLETASVKDIDETTMARRIAGMDRVAGGRRPRTSDQTRVEIRDLYGDGINGISLNVGEGEILGLSGLLGAGRSSVMRVLCGEWRPYSGEIRLDGEPLKLKHPADGVLKGIGYVSAERQRYAVFPDRPLRENISMPNLRRYWRRLYLSRAKEAGEARDAIKRYQIIAASEEAPASTLSGGNQQKAMIARWLELKPRLLLLNEPTQGVDVGARAEIHRMVRDAAENGTTVIVSSADPQELAELCHRVIGLYWGRMTGEASGDELTPGKCVELAQRLPIAAGADPDGHPAGTATTAEQTG